MINEFLYAQPVKIWFGRGAFSRLDEVLRKFDAERCVIVCGRHFAAQAEKLMAENISIAGVYSQVEQNPQLSGAVEAARIAQDLVADTIIGIGGGSAIDTAKFAAAIALGDQDPVDYFTGLNPFPRKRLNVITIPTTAGTGAEVTRTAVMSCGEEKRTINDPAFMPKAAIVDPTLSAGMPPRTTVITGLDALAHALEGYWSKNHQPISDLMAVEAVRLILANLEQAYRHGDDLEARECMAYASTLGGLSFAVPKTAGAHACSYPLTEDYHLPHGEAVAFTLDSFVRINADERLELLCSRVGLKNSGELVERIAAFKAMGGLRTRLSELGQVDLDRLCHDCAEHPLMKNNPVPMDEARLRELFEALK